MKIGKWSTTASNNNATPPDGWPEGQAANTVNDCAREMMASIKTLVNDADYIDYDTTPSFLSATTFSLGTASVQFEVGRRIKLFDATTLYGTIASVSSTFVAVRLDSGALTGSLSSVALGVLRNSNLALPSAAYNTANTIINGQFDIWQRTASAVSVTNNQYVADRFKYEGVNTASVNITRLERSATVSYVPTLISAGTLIANSMNVFISAVDASIASADYAGITYVVEGFDWRKIAHQPNGLSFQVNTNCSGVYSLAIRSSALSKSYVTNYTISAINTWVRFFVPLPEAPTDVSWNYNENAGLWITWTLSSGGNYSASAGAWVAGNLLHTGSQVNFLGTTGNSWTITDVRLKAGNTDTPTIPRPFALELEACQRYYEKGFSTVYYTASGTEEQRSNVQFAASKRVTPTITLHPGAQNNVALAAAVNPSTSKFDHRVASSGAGTAADDGAAWEADAEL